MLFVIDVGNTNMVMGVFNGMTLEHHWRIRTERNTTEDEFYVLVSGLFARSNISFKAIEKTKRGKGNEIQLTDAMLLLLKREKIMSCAIEGKRYDIGNKLDYLKTMVEFALKRPEFAKPFEVFLKETLAERKTI